MKFVKKYLSNQLLSAKIECVEVVETKARTRSLIEYSSGALTLSSLRREDGEGVSDGALDWWGGGAVSRAGRSCCDVTLSVTLRVG